MCPDKSILSAYFDGEVDLQWSGEIIDHLKECNDCSSYINELQNQKKLLQSAPMPDFNDSLDRVKMRVRERRNIKGSLRFWEKRIPLPVAAAAAVIVATVTFGANMVAYNRSGKTQMADAGINNFSDESYDFPAEKLDELFSQIESANSDEFNSNSIVTLPADVELIFHGDSQLVRTAGFNGSASP